MGHARKELGLGGGVRVTTSCFLIRRWSVPNNSATVWSGVRPLKAVTSLSSELCGSGADRDEVSSYWRARSGFGEIVSRLIEIVCVLIEVSGRYNLPYYVTQGEMSRNALRGNDSQQETLVCWSYLQSPKMTSGAVAATSDHSASWAPPCMQLKRINRSSLLMAHGARDLELRRLWLDQARLSATTPSEIEGD